MKIIGIDLSGPANHKDTVMAIFQVDSNRLIFEKMIMNASDEKTLSNLFDGSVEGTVVIGVDAPLLIKMEEGTDLRIRACEIL